MPVHKVCFMIAKRFCRGQRRHAVAFRDASSGVPNSIHELYEIWCKRAMISCPGGLMINPIPEANGYFGAPGISFPTMRQYYRAMANRRSLRRFTACPLVIPRLTNIVVNFNLQTIDSEARHPPKEAAGLLRCIQAMSQEIVDIIIGALKPFEQNGGPPLQPTRILPTWWWKEELLSGKLIPWLWDLDDEEITQYRLETFYDLSPEDAMEDNEGSEDIFDENMWDWELLCRQLAQAKVFKRGRGLL